MGITVKETGNGGDKYTPAPAGVAAARCIGVIDMGLQEASWQGNTKMVPKVRLEFELVDEARTYEVDGETKEVNYTIGSTYTASLGSKAKLRGLLESWRGRPFTQEELNGFNMSALLGKPCLLNISHNEANNGKTYANIASITPVMKGMKVSAATYTPRLFDLDDPDMEVFSKLSAFLQEKILPNLPKGAEAAQVPAEEPEANDVDDDMPF